jgi:hypothetical protein
MSLANYSGGPNPFLVASKLLGRMGKKPEQAQSEALMQHMAASSQAHEHALGIIHATYQGALSHMKETNKLAEPGTAVSVSAPGHSASYTKKTKQPKTPKVTEPKKVEKVVYNEPGTGRLKSRIK